MSGNKYRNISVRFLLITSLCLCYVLMTSQRAFSAVQTSPYYIVESYRKPSVVYKIVGGKSRDLFTHQRNIKSIAVWGGELYFSLVGDNRIYKKVGPGRGDVYFTHGNQIKDIAFDSRGVLYFTEVSGSANRSIYNIDPRSRRVGHYRSVPLRNINGFWDGNFAFDMAGNLYLSSGGNRTPAFIYRAVSKGYTDIYRDDRGTIRGVAIDPHNPNFVYYANGKSIIYKVNRQYRQRGISFSTPPLGRIEFSDVVFDMRRR